MSLKSPLICATTSRQYSLQFVYKISTPNKCELSVICATDNDVRHSTLWSDTKEKGEAHIETISNDDALKSFRAKKLAKDQYCRFTLGDIVFKYAGDLSSVPTTNNTTDFDMCQTTYSPRTSEEGSLAGGAVAAIVISIVVIIAVCVVIVLFFRRRKAEGENPVSKIFNHFRQSKQTSLKRATGAGSVSNSAHVEEGQRYTITTTRTKPQISGSMHVEAPHLGPGFEWKSQSSEDDVMESSNYYSMPVDDDGNCVPLAHVNERTKRGTADYDEAVLPESDGGYCSPDDVDVKDSRSRVQVVVPRANVAGGGGSNYNKLSLQTAHGGYPKTKNTDTYSHIQEQDNVYKVPRSGTQEQDNVYKVPRSGAGSVYSLATNHEESDGRPSARANADVKGKGSTAAPSERADYHHLNLKDGRSATPDTSRGQGEKGGVYSHLSNQGEAGDNYNRVEFDKHTQRKQSAQCDEPYNHLSGGQL
ncbi:hypothetical protein BaRGS_00018626 [Batillaria attramentaria]|uniref:Uncharacterized protein n=1 Tax=Batillaria attramentaria TaxID=370345 RepID=A0ABD0KT65_9CAEN